MIRLAPQHSNDPYLYKNLWDFDPVEQELTVNGVSYDTREVIFNAIRDERMGVHMVVDRSGTPIAYFGVAPLRSGVGELWIIRGSGFKDNALSVVKAARKLGDDLLASGFFRLEVAVSEEWEKWAQMIGFEFEHICRKYDGVNDLKVYTRLA